MDHREIPILPNPSQYPDSQTSRHSLGAHQLNRRREAGNVSTAQYKNSEKEKKPRSKTPNPHNEENPEIRT